MLHSIALVLALAANEPAQHPYVGAVLEYRAAKKAEDVDAMRSIVGVCRADHGVNMRQTTPLAVAEHDASQVFPKE